MRKNLLAKRIFQIVEENGGIAPDRFGLDRGEWRSVRGRGLWAYYGDTQVPVAPIRRGGDRRRYLLSVARKLAKRAEEQKNLGEVIFAEIRPEGLDIILG